jgi:hypothetical protein
VTKIAQLKSGRTKNTNTEWLTLEFKTLQNTAAVKYILFSLHFW